MTRPKQTEQSNPIQYMLKGASLFTSHSLVPAMALMGQSLVNAQVGSGYQLASIQSGEQAEKTLTTFGWQLVDSHGVQMQALPEHLQVIVGEVIWKKECFCEFYFEFHSPSNTIMMIIITLTLSSPSLNK